MLDEAARRAGFRVGLALAGLSVLLAVVPLAAAERGGAVVEVLTGGEGFAVRCPSP